MHTRPSLRSGPHRSIRPRPPAPCPSGRSGRTRLRRWGRVRPVPGGFTLLELATVLLLVSLALGALAPAVHRQADREAVRSAREAVVGMVASARARAVDAGGVTLGLDPAGDSLWLEVDGRRSGCLRLGRELRVDLGPEGPLVRLRFGPLGLGRIASRTLTVRRGSAERKLTLSAYGRVKRW